MRLPAGKVRRVLVTGVGAVTPLGATAEVLLDRWCAGEQGFDRDAGRARDFRPADHLAAREIRRTDRFAQLAVGAADQAVTAAGWARRLPVEPDRVGCVVGTAYGGLATYEREHARFLRPSGARISPLTTPLLMPNAAAATLAMRYGLYGATASIGTACASGADAIGMAARAIAFGQVEAALAGGAEAPLTPMFLEACRTMGATSPTGTSRPFDIRRDGFICAEGAGVLALEAEELALARGAPVLGEVLGYGCSTDAYHLSAPRPDGAGAALAIRCALADAGLGPSDVAYVNAHGTSTLLNDRMEVRALKTALGEHAGRIPVSSLKSVTGHMIGAAGAVEAVATLLALNARVVPPTVALEEPDPALDLDFVPGIVRTLPSANRNAAHVTALSNSFGFGGHNAVLCLRVWPADHSARAA